MTYRTYYGLSASYTDKDGYTVTVSSRKTSTDKLHSRSKMRNGHSTDMYEPYRSGRITITNPNGETRGQQFWMDFPEKGWFHHGVDLFADWDAKIDVGRKHEAVWYTIPIQKR